jgi:hypothetical protein
MKTRFLLGYGLAVLLALLAVFSQRWAQARLARVPESAAAWHNIGGCGASGGGAAAGAGKWIGRSVTGGLVDLEVLANRTLGGDYVYNTTGVGLTFHKPSLPNYTGSVSLGWKAATFEYEGYKTGSDPTPPALHQVGGFSDLGLGLNRLFGNENEHSVGVALSLPTGRHDIKRLNRKFNAGDDVRWINPFAQPGTGLYTAGLSYEYTKDRDWGLFVFGGSYSAAFAWENNDCREAPLVTVNEKVAYCQAAAPSALTWKLWELKHQPWGFTAPASWEESPGVAGTGATGADAVSLYAHVGHKEEGSAQSAGLTLAVPLAPTYWWEYGPNPDNKVSTRKRIYDVTMKLSLGLEISNPRFPVFFAVGIPWVLNDVAERGRLVNPQNYVGTVGFRGTFF